MFNCSKIIIIAIYQSIVSEYLELFLLSEVAVLWSRERGKELLLRGESSLGLTAWRAERSRGKCAGDFSLQLCLTSTSLVDKVVTYDLCILQNPT